MKLTVAICALLTLALTAGGVILAASGSAEAPQPKQQAQHTMTKSDFEHWMTELSNWGRWGKDDELGAMNLITPGKRKQAVLLVKEGVSVSLAHDVEKESAPDNNRPFGHVLTKTPKLPDGFQFSLDTYTFSYHGYVHTHLDALCHAFYNGKMYNGFSEAEVTEKGAARLGINNLKGGIVTRGILIDIPKLKGVPWLEPGTPIYPEDLDAWEKKAGLRVSSGDVIFIRTGRWARRLAKGPWDVQAGAAGLHASCAKWLKDRNVAMIGSDAVSDVMPSGIEGVSLPIHKLALIALGVHIFDNCELESLSEAAASRGRWEFLLTASPMAIPGGTGSPLNPIATF